MAETIQVEYEVLTQAKNKFTQLMDEITQMSNSINGKAEALRQDGWQGRGSDAFYNEMNDRVTPALGRLHQALEQASSTTNQIAEVYHEADESAQQGIIVV
jgi:WXG100 family type VII secretion target